MFWFHSVVEKKKQEVEKKAPKPQQRRDSPFVALTEVKIKRRNKGDTGESSTGEYSSDLHSLSHTQLPSVTLPYPT